MVAYSILTIFDLLAGVRLAGVRLADLRLAGDLDLRLADLRLAGDLDLRLAGVRLADLRLDGVRLADLRLSGDFDLRLVRLDGVRLVERFARLECDFFFFLSNCNLFDSKLSSSAIFYK
jgi:hypothetical protein